jgi:hypothetical protein
MPQKGIFLPYGYTFDPKNDDLRLENRYFWDDISLISRD